MYRKSHLIEARYFIQAHEVVVEYRTNAHGKRIVAMSIEKGGNKLNLNSAKELENLIKILNFTKKETKRKWILKKKTK